MFVTIDKALDHRISAAVMAGGHVRSCCGVRNARAAHFALFFEAESCLNLGSHRLVKEEVDENSST